MYGVLLLATITTAAGAPGQAPAEGVRPDDMVLRWNEITLQAIKADRTPPPKASRHLAMVHVAAYDAVNAVTGTHRPFRVQTPVAEKTSPEAAAAAAAHRVLIDLYPAQKDGLDRALDRALAELPAGDERDEGVRLGRYVAGKVLAWRRADGAGREGRHTVGKGVGVWRPTPPGFRPGLLPGWAAVAPFAVTSGEQFRPKPPPELTSAAYAENLNEVKSLGARDSRSRTAEQTLIALFWADGDGTVTPPGHWNRIAQVVARQRGTTLAESARLFALLNVCLADAGVCCWECKFKYALWRPMTAVRDADLDGNPDTERQAGWRPLLTTPPFPSYTSGHSTFSGAGAAALASFFGTDAVRFTTTSEGAPGQHRAFEGFWAAAQEAGRSRIYGGIHYEFDNSAGLAMGRDIANHVARNFFQPRSRPSVSEKEPGDAMPPADK
jgi:membrane-associated phospholipid phosphatase